MEEEGLHGPRYAASVAQQSDHRRILCSSEQSKLCPCPTKSLLSDSGAGNLTLFIKKSIFSGQIKVVKIDKATMDYYIRLTEFHKQFQAVGNNYNQVVRALKNNFGEKRARALLYKLERLSLELMLICKKVMALTQEYERKWLQ